MPWEQMSHEIRHRVKEPTAFKEGSFFVKEFQVSPRIYAVMGRLQGETTSTIQSMRFGVPGWTMESAKKWYEEHKGKIEKSAEEIDEVFLEKANLKVQGYIFDSGQFDESGIKEWLKKKATKANISKNGNRYQVEVKPLSDFRKGSLRDISFAGGITATIGIPLAKIEKRVPDRFSINAENLNELSEISIEEVTLTRSPAVGKMAEFRLVKSAEIEEETYSEVVPIVKIDTARKQVGAYVLIPDLPDWQGDLVSSTELEKSAHRFMRNLAHREQLGTGVGHEHGVFDGVGYPIESFVDREGNHGIAGGWWLTTQITSEPVWKSITSGEIIGYSVGGKGVRRKLAIVQDLPKPIIRKNSPQGNDPGGSDPRENFPEGNDPEGNDPGGNDPIGIVQKFFTWLKGTGEPVQNKAIEEDEMKFDLLKKLDISPSAAEALEKSGVDLEKAHEATEELAKAIGLNLSQQGLGHATIQIVSAMRNGDWGSWPNTEIGFGGNIQKSAPNPSTPSDEVKKLQEDLGKMAEIIQKTTAAYETATTRLDALEKTRGVRKSQPDVVVTQPAQSEDSGGWSAMDGIDVSVAEAEALAKSIGVFDEYNATRGRR